MAPLVERLTYLPRMEQATDPVECVHTLAQDFKSITWQTSTGSSAYNDWLLDKADLAPPTNITAAHFRCFSPVVPAVNGCSSSHRMHCISRH